MYLSTIDLYELGQYLRIALWICLPLIIISLLVTTWLHYRRRFPDPGGLRLSVEGLDNAMGPEGMPHLSGEPLSYREHEPDDPAERDPGPLAERGPDPLAERDLSTHVKRDPDPAGNDPQEKESVSEWKGKDNIYQGILWMKEKYEQYRAQADQRYELLKEKLNESERRYQDLLLSIEENKSLKPTQLIIEELEEQLRIERLKVEELVARLQSNSQLLSNIYQELDKSVHTAKEAE